MKALSVRQPWAWAILHAGKDVENRSWSPGKTLKPSDRFAIHASQSFDVAGLRWIVENHEELGLRLEDIPIEKSAYPVGAVVGSVEYGGLTPSGVGRWWFGPVGWKVSKPVVLAEPVPMKGRLGLWDVDEAMSWMAAEKKRGLV